MLGNPDIMWEEQQKTTLGLHIGIAKGTTINLKCMSAIPIKLLHNVI
ncbi:hypothetical protein [Capnocytophaga ochracea]|nr:hypothetical protein [Capnocytophaga ochracea]